MSETVYIIAGGTALLLIGVGLGFWLAHLRSGKQVAKVADVQKQFDDYRQNVTEHFGRTAKHFQAIGEQYRELYEHMASGADSLIDPQAMDEKLSLIPAENIAPPADDNESDAKSTTVESTSETKDDADEPERTYH